MFRDLTQDLRFAGRVLWKSPGFTFAALLTLALGIGANTAIFSVVNAVLLNPLPYAEPGRLVFIWDTQTKKAEKSTFPVSAPNFKDWQEQNHSFENMSVLSYEYFTLAGREEPVRLFGSYVSANLLQTLGVKPEAGRAFLPEEEQAEHSRVVMLSHGMWQRRFGSDPKIIGQTLTLDNNLFTIVGVLPPEFRLPRQVSLGVLVMDEVDLLLPVSYLGVVEPNTVSKRARHFLTAVGRLRPGVSREQAGAEMTNIAAQLAEQYPAANANFTVHLVPMHEQIVGRVRTALLLLQGAVLFVLLIACANVTNLLLARAAARRREIGIRAALGARRLRLVRQLLTEGVLLWLVGGGLGLLIALWGTQALLAANPTDIPRIKEAGVDPWVLGYTLLVAFVSGVLFTLLPALQTAKSDFEALKEGGRGNTLSTGRVLRNALVVSEVALALVLLIGASLLIKSFERVLNVNPGFRPESVTTMELFLSPQTYNTTEMSVNYHRALMEKVKNTPGVAAAGVVNILPLKGSTSVAVGVEGQPEPPPGEELYASHRIVSADYFTAMGIPLKQGRAFTDRDAPGAPPVAIISAELARKLFGDKEPLGQRVEISMGKPGPVEVVGVVGDVRQNGLEAEPDPEVYVPFLQNPWPAFTLVARTTTDAQSTGPLVRAAAASVDRTQPVGEPALLEKVLGDTLSQRRLNMLLLTIFSGVALVLAVVGIYGVMSYAVTQRTHEIGLRMALGAGPGAILRLVVGQGMILSLVGVGLGLLAAVGLTRLMDSLVYQVSTYDPLIFGGGTLLLSLAALLACYVPAQRATKVDPLVALRNE
ncbi:MAG: ABC transporter permease [Acidobacteria bacterium]|nr:ABC transporter permease [Acidobacteriota bacterium]